ncbi:hypothetical protein GCM10027018_08280 [Paenibacillus thermoaerophilus]
MEKRTILSPTQHRANRIDASIDPTLVPNHVPSQLSFHKADHRLHDAFTRAFARHKDIAFVRITDEPLLP